MADSTQPTPAMATTTIATTATATADTDNPTNTLEPPAPPPPERPYGGFTRFEIELEFVQALSNPLYLNHLAVEKYYDKAEFVEYLKYLQYWKHPEYITYLSYPGPTLRALELLQIQQFRTDILVPDLVDRMIREGIEASYQGGET